MRACDWRSCDETATIKLRFGDGFYTTGRTDLRKGHTPKGSGTVHQQTFAFYCDTHSVEVDRLFFTCDIAPAETRRREVV
jgi:hypothetical protein